MLRLVFILLCLQNDWQMFGARAHSSTQEFCNAGMCYSLHWNGVSFAHAKKLCEGRKGTLTTMESEAEAENVKQLLAKMVKGRTQPYHLWIGLRRNAKQCYIPDKPLRGFSWVSGTDQSTYSPWIREPSRTCTHERCVQLQVNFSNQGQFYWVTSLCAKVNDGFICKYEMCEALNTNVGKVVYQKAPQSESQPFPGVPRGSVAIISCASGNSIALRCELQNGRIVWSSEKLESLCNKCWNQTSDGPCENGCFEIPQGFFCYCDEGFLVDYRQSKCIPGGVLENGFNEFSRTRLKDTQSLAANTTPFLVSTAATKALTTHSLQPTENATVTFSPGFRAPGQGKREAHSNAPFLVYQVVIGVLVLMLLIAIAVIIFRGRGKTGSQETAPSRVVPTNTDSLLQVNEKAPEERGNAPNENHYVETPSASEGDVNIPVDNGEISQSAAH
ncbi:complement component C1q receptor-like [Mustelus asterias]